MATSFRDANQTSSSGSADGSDSASANSSCTESDGSGGWNSSGSSQSSGETTHDDFNYQNNCSQSLGPGWGNSSSGSGPTNQVNGWSQTWGEATNSCFNSYAETITTPGFDSPMYYSGPGLYPPASMTDPGSPAGGDWYEGTAASTANSLSATALTAGAPARPVLRRPPLTARPTVPPAGRPRSPTPTGA